MTITAEKIEKETSEITSLAAALGLSQLTTRATKAFSKVRNKHHEKSIRDLILLRDGLLHKGQIELVAQINSLITKIQILNQHDKGYDPADLKLVTISVNTNISPVSSDISYQVSILNDSESKLTYLPTQALEIGTHYFNARADLIALILVTIWMSEETQISGPDTLRLARKYIHLFDSLAQEDWDLFYKYKSEVRNMDKNRMATLFNVALQQLFSRDILMRDESTKPYEYYINPEFEPHVGGLCKAMHLTSESPLG